LIIYEIRWQDKIEGLCIKWAGSKVGAAKAKAEVRKYYRKQKAGCWGLEAGRSNFDLFYDTIKHDIPSGKQGLVDWLNRFNVHDNG